MPNFTRKAIMDASIRLLETKALNKITVKDIVEECGISRNSFYYHFEDVPSLLTAIITETVDKIIAEPAGAENLLDFVDIATKIAIENKKAVLNVYKHTDRELFEQYLNKIITHCYHS